MPTQSPAAKRAADARSTLNAYRRLFSTEDGKIVLKDLMKCCFFFTPTIGQDSTETFFNEGQRAVILRLLQTSKMNQQQIQQLSDAMIAQADEYID